MIVSRRAQAAMEFLTTYGWAFLVVLVMVGALAYFGVLNPQNLVSDRCVAPPGFDCVDYKISAGATTLKIRNLQGFTVSIPNGVMTFDSASGDSFICSTGSAVNGVIDGQEFWISCGSTAYNAVTNSLVSGEKVKADININYYKTLSGSSFSKVGKVSLVSTFSNS